MNEALFEPVVRLGVTGLARSGKTVFITSLVANMLDRGRMAGLQGAPHILAAYLQPQPDDTVPRFEYESHLQAMTGSQPYWPESTRSISELRLSFRVAPTGMLAGLRGPRVVHVDIVDYPGEWLLDLLLLEKTYEEWSSEVLARLQTRPEAAAFLALVQDTDPAATLDEPAAQALARAFATYLHAARDAGRADCTPGRFLLPGDLDGSPVLTFAPLPAGDFGRGTLGREMARRFEAYKRKVVQPFFRDHFARIDRQVVLVDALGALGKGRAGAEEVRDSLSDLLQAFRPGPTPLLARLLGGKRVERILFAATKADHLHHSQHADLAALMANIVRKARDRADFAGADTAAMALASLRATTEVSLRQNSGVLDAVQGRIAGRDRPVAFDAGEIPKTLGAVPEVPPQALAQGVAFAPAPLTLLPGQGPPHIRLDRVAEFLIGDLFR